MNQAVTITKASGLTEVFKSEKLAFSLQKAGADKETITEILKEVESFLYPKITTAKIYTLAFAVLRKKNLLAQYKYKMKQAILQFGETGYPFEHLIAEVFKRKGYIVKVGEVVQGHCVSHEIDVFAYNDHYLYLVECKYSPNRKKQVSIQTPLYVKARMDDVILALQKEKEYSNLQFKPMLAVSTRFSSDTIAYGNCVDLSLLSWEYPKEKNLFSLMSDFKIYPITLLNNLSKKDKLYLLEKGVVSCTGLKANQEALDSLNLSIQKQRAVNQELEIICES
ncbi:MAG: ATPase [Luteibaculaceae bacterium]